MPAGCPADSSKVPNPSGIQSQKSKGAGGGVHPPPAVVSSPLIKSLPWSKVPEGREIPACGHRGIVQRKRVRRSGFGLPRRPREVRGLVPDLRREPIAMPACRARPVSRGAGGRIFHLHDRSSHRSGFLGPPHGRFHGIRRSRALSRGDGVGSGTAPPATRNDRGSGLRPPDKCRSPFVKPCTADRRSRG